jgi:Holliday junction DNA helicase RuvA
MACIDAYPLAGLVRAIESEDLTALSRIPGVGKKTAQRLCLELKGKLQPGIEIPSTTKPAPAAPAEDILALALTRLGYSRSEIDAARLRMKSDGVSDDAKPEDRVRAALRILSGGDR